MKTQEQMSEYTQEIIKKAATEGITRAQFTEMVCKLTVAAMSANKQLNYKFKSQDKKTYIINIIEIQEVKKQ